MLYISKCTPSSRRGADNTGQLGSRDLFAKRQLKTIDAVFTIEQLLVRDPLEATGYQAGAWEQY